MVVVNLKPAKLAGVLSEGMLLCAEDADGNLSLMVPEKKMPSGAEIWLKLMILQVKTLAVCEAAEKEEQRQMSEKQFLRHGLNAIS